MNEEGARAEGRSQASQTLGVIAKARREYADGAPDDMRRFLICEAEILEAAAKVVDGDEKVMARLVPSWWPESEWRTRTLVTDLDHAPSSTIWKGQRDA